MNLSLILFVATVVLLVLCFRYAWAVVWECGLLTWLTLLTVGVCSCSTQVSTTTDGTRLVNNNFLSKGALIRDASGATVMVGDSEEAAKRLGDYGKLLINAGLITEGVKAAQSLGNNAIDAVK